MFVTRELLALAAPVRWRIAGLAAIGLLAIGLELLWLVLAGYATGAVLAGRPLSDLLPLIAGAAAAAAARGIILFLKDEQASRTAARVKQALRTRIYRHLLTLGPGYLERRKTGALAHSAVEGVEVLEVYYGKYLPQVLVVAGAPIGILAYLWTLDPPLAVVAAISLPVALLAPAAFISLTRQAANRHWRVSSQMSTLVLDSLYGLPTLKAFACSRARGRQIAEVAARLYRATMRALAISQWRTGVGNLTIAVGGAALLAVGALRASEGSLGVPALVVVLLVLSDLFRPVREMNRFHHQGLNGVSAAEGIFRLLADRPEVVARATPAATPVDTSIRFEVVTFGYDAGSRPALRDFSLEVKPGELVALVGPSGAGKTTVVNLLLRYFDPQRGRILVGGVDIRDLPLAQLRALFATVCQETYLFHTDVAENLRLARPEAHQASLEAAARAARAHDFIAALPVGYQTVVGERGLRLSGGERQRIAIARALLKDAPILLLDEPTSSVDAENEEAIQEALGRLAQGRTTLLIAHRLSTVAEADRIVVLENGRVVESGRHAELLAAGGAYTRLVAAQRVDDLQPASAGGVA